MRPLISALSLSALVLTLASCASVPSQDKLLTGIDQTQFAQGATKTARAATDPVCVDFYANVADFEKNAQSNKGMKNFFSTLGLNVASAVVARSVIPAGVGNQAARVAASSAATSVTSVGRQAALRELNSSNRADAKIIEVAGEIGCPVNIKP